MAENKEDAISRINDINKEILYLKNEDSEENSVKI